MTKARFDIVDRTGNPTQESVGLDIDAVPPVGTRIDLFDVVAVVTSLSFEYARSGRRDGKVEQLVVIRAEKI